MQIGNSTLHTNISLHYSSSSSLIMAIASGWMNTNVVLVKLAQFQFQLYVGSGTDLTNISGLTSRLVY